MTNPLKYTCLFGGGAVRGLAYVGTIRALEELGVEYDIIGGSSVGAIIASLVACGYKSYEVENFFMKVNFTLFKDIHLGFGKVLAISKGEIFTDWLNNLLSNKYENIKGRNVKFLDVDKKLIIVTTDLKNFKCKEFSTKISPDFEVAEAIKISSSMPGLMAPFETDDTLLVDGDLQKASPMWRLCDGIKESNSRILEFRLEGDYNKDEKNPLSYINTIYSCVTDIATEFVSEIYGCNDRYDYITINTGDVFFADFNLNKEARRNLINIGYAKTMDYFKNILPIKKEKILKVYEEIAKYLKKAHKGLKSNNVEEVQWWFGYIFTTMCENKELIDVNIYNKIIDIKNSIYGNFSTVLFFHHSIKNIKILENDMSLVIEQLEKRINELKLYIQMVNESS